MELAIHRCAITGAQRQGDIGGAAQAQRLFEQFDLATGGIVVQQGKDVATDQVGHFGLAEFGERRVDEHQPVRGALGTAFDNGHPVAQPRQRGFEQGEVLLEALAFHQFDQHAQAARRFQMQRRPTPCAAAHGLLPQIETLARRQPRIGDVLQLGQLRVAGPFDLLHLLAAGPQQGATRLRHQRHEDETGCQWGEVGQLREHLADGVHMQGADRILAQGVVVFGFEMFADAAQRLCIRHAAMTADFIAMEDRHAIGVDHVHQVRGHVGEHVHGQVLGVVEVGDQFFADGQQHRLQPRPPHRLQRADAPGQRAGHRIGGIAHGMAGEVRAVVVTGNQPPQRIVDHDRGHQGGADAHVGQVFQMHRRDAAQADIAQIHRGAQARMQGGLDRRRLVPHIGDLAHAVAQV